MKLFTIHLIYRSELWGAFTLATGEGEMENTIIDIKMTDSCIKVVNSPILTDNPRLLSPISQWYCFSFRPVSTQFPA